MYRRPCTDTPGMREPGLRNSIQIKPMRNILVVLSAATVYMALSGFDCASTEMTTAKVAIQRKDLTKAEESLKKEVAARPQNSEAWVLLGDIYEQQGRYSDMSDAYGKALAATQPVLKPEQKANIYAKRYNLWLMNFNSALSLRDSAEATSNNALLQEALRRVDTAMLVRPGYPDNYFVRAAIYRDMKDDAAAARANRDYVEAARSDIDAGMKAGLALGMSPEQVEAALGKPDGGKVTQDRGGFLHYTANDLYVYFSPSGSGGAAMVEGWHYFNNDGTPEQIKGAQYTLRSAPYYTLGVDSYFAGEKDPKQYDQALTYLQMVQQLDRQQGTVGQVVADIYVKTNRTDEARRSFEENIRQNPNDPALYINYGTLLVGLKDYNTAIRTLEKGLALTKAGEERHLTSLYNLGAVYKNWGATLQDSIKRVSNDRESAAQREVYAAKLRESLKYFEQYRAAQGGTDFAVLSELANLYIVLDNQPKLQETISSLEKVESTNASNRDYWQAMSRIYAIVGETRKAEAAQAKADGL